MKTLWIIHWLRHGLILAMFPLNLVHAQSPPPGRMEKMRDEIEAIKIGLITRRLNLTAEEARAFWPVYNQYSEELEAIRKQRRNEMRQIMDRDNELSDKDAEKLVDNEIVLRQKELDIMKKYHAQFKQILPVKKVMMLYRAEEDFKRLLLERLHEKREHMMERARQRRR
jgi:Spy/CpxP family protein refolding chaperone